MHFHIFTTTLTLIYIMFLFIMLIVYSKYVFDIVIVIFKFMYRITERSTEYSCGRSWEWPSRWSSVVHLPSVGLVGPVSWRRKYILLCSALEMSLMHRWRDNYSCKEYIYACVCFDMLSRNNLGIFLSWLLRSLAMLHLCISFSGLSWVYHINIFWLTPV